MFKNALAQLGDDAQKVDLAMATIDPARDTTTWSAWCLCRRADPRGPEYRSHPDPRYTAALLSPGGGTTRRGATWLRSTLVVSH